jgi:hypothetical protein
MYSLWLMEIVDTDGRIMLSLRNVVNSVAGGFVLTEHEDVVDIDGEKNSGEVDAAIRGAGLKAQTADRHAEEEPDPWGPIEAVKRLVTREDMSRESSVDKGGSLLNKHHEVAVTVEKGCLQVDVEDMEHEECGESE